MELLNQMKIFDNGVFQVTTKNDGVFTGDRKLGSPMLFASNPLVTLGSLGIAAKGFDMMFNPQKDVLSIPDIDKEAANAMGHAMKKTGGLVWDGATSAVHKMYDAFAHLGEKKPDGHVK